MAPLSVQEEIDRVAPYGQRLQDLLDGDELELSGGRDALLIVRWNLLLDYHVASCSHRDHVHRTLITRLVERD